MKYTMQKGDEVQILETDFPATAESYAKKYGFTIVSVEDDKPTPMTQAEIEEMLLDQEYRILLLEYGLEDDEEVW